MIIGEYIAVAVDQIRTTKLRAFLTVLGITIGIATVIFIVSVLEGYNKSVNQQLNVLGANTFQVQRDDPLGQSGNPHQKKKARKNLKRELAQAIRQNCDLVEAVAAEEKIFGVVMIYKKNKTNPNVSLYGSEPDFFMNNGYFPADGRILTEQDLFSHRRVIVLGMDLVDVLFPFENPLGQWIKVNGIKFKVVGTLERMGNATFGQSRDNLAVIPITTLEDIWGKNRSVSLTVRVKEGADFEAAQSQVIGVLRKERKVPPGAENDFSIFSNETLEDAFRKIALQVKMVAILLGMISLLVGSIGVMNIMLVTVTERTREIGIRKAVGAKSAAILVQFLNEAVVLTLIGGVIGLILGFGLAGVVAVFLKIPFVVPVWVVASSLAVTALVGVLAGLYPAARAARMNPITALRYE